MNQIIKDELEIFIKKFTFFRGKTDHYVFNALCAKAIFYKNPSFSLDEESLKQIVVDGANDQGLDCILTDESSDYKDLILMQCKYYESISLEQIKEALNKMLSAFKLLKSFHFEQFNEMVGQQYQRCEDEREEQSKIRFCFVTSAPQGGIKFKSIINYFDSQKGELPIELLEDDIYFEKQMIEAIQDSRSFKSCVEAGELVIDAKDNLLEYGEGCVFNISALSLKKLYNIYKNGLLSQNLRYYIKHKTIDRDVENSIKDNPNDFWYKNNGITIVCDKFDVDSKRLKLTNFSIVNGGQTTRKIFDSPYIDENNDLYLLCRVIQNPGRTKEEKQQFVFEISKATNSQKAIKPSDLKANNPEQLIFAEALKANNIIYKTKRGMEVPSSNKEAYQNCDLLKVGKLALAGMFIMPGTSRNKPSIIFDETNSFYEDIFNSSNANDTAAYIKDLLYVDYSFDKRFIGNYRMQTKNDNKKLFAGNCRTFCTAFVGFLAKYYNGEFDKNEIKAIINVSPEDSDSCLRIQKILKKQSMTKRVFKKELFNLDEIDSLLASIFKYIISEGSKIYDAYTNAQSEDVVNETNWLKRDSSFYKTIKASFDDFSESAYSQEFEKLFK
ncbi:MAG: AIPR family protein [Bacilli bacterium]|jgi:hypothetical protein